MIRENIEKIRGRVASICSKTNRNPDAITIVAVSKGRAAEQISEVIRQGITDIGENKVQEALLQYQYLRSTVYGKQPVRWHMVGHLQTNKAREAVRIFDLIHSVDSIHLALEINKQAVKINKIQDILIEIKTSPEATKFGMPPEQVIEAIKEMVELKNINIKGLMTIAPLVDNAEKARPYFKTLRELMNKINALGLTACSLQLLSMGMTEDFEVAIEEGANMLRLGRAIFG